MAKKKDLGQGLHALLSDVDKSPAKKTNRPFFQLKKLGYDFLSPTLCPAKA